MKSKRTLWKTASLVILVAVGGVAWNVARVRAFNPQPDPPGKFGMVGIIRGQAIRLNVVNTAPPPTNDLPPDPCIVRLTFLDAAGQPFTNPRTGQPVQRIVTLQPGQATFLALDADDFVSETRRRLQLRPKVELQAGQLPPDPCIPTMEVIESETGRTSLFSEGSPRLPPPVSD